MSVQHQTVEPSYFSSALCFLQGFIRQPEVVGSILPSSNVLNKKIERLDCVRSASQVVELGPGTGGTTAALLRGMPSDGRLLCVEIHGDFVRQLQRIPDPRLSVAQGDACDLTQHLHEERIQPGTVDLIISGIPFSIMKRHQADDLMQQIFRALAVGGSFVAYQIRDRVTELADGLFGEPEVSWVYRNVPPLRIFRWQKSDHAAECGS